MTAARFGAIGLLCSLVLITGPVAAEATVEGVWLSGDGDGWIEIRQQGDEVVGVIAGSPNNKPGDPPRLDEKNPDPSLRHRELDGMIFMTGFIYSGENRWSGGTIYDPNSGNTYKGTMRLVDRNTLKLRGYIGISLFGRSDTWTRVED